MNPQAIAKMMVRPERDKVAQQLREGRKRYPALTRLLARKMRIARRQILARGGCPLGITFEQFMNGKQFIDGKRP